MTAFPWAVLPTVPELPPARFRIIRGFRMVVAFHQARRNPLPTLSRLFGCAGAAQAFLGFMHRCGHYWPEPLIVQHPCCAQTSYDEILVTDMISAAVQQDRKVFDRLLFEMLGHEARDDLYRSCMGFVTPFLAARPAD